MGLALKTGFLGISLRKTSLFLLHIHVLIYVLKLLEELTYHGGAIDRLMKGNVVEWTVGVLLVKSLAIECYIFIVAIWSIFKLKSTDTVLSMALVVILMNNLYLIYVVIVINFGVHHALRENIQDGSLVEMSSLGDISEITRRNVLDLLLRSYIAWVIYSYRVQLKKQCVGNILPTYSSARYKREADIATDTPPAYEDLETIAPLRDPNEATSSV